MTIKDLKDLAEKAERGGMFRVDFVQAATPWRILALIERYESMIGFIRSCTFAEAIGIRRNAIRYYDECGPKVPL